MPGLFELKNAAGGQFMFNLLAGNNKIILTSENYKEKHSAKEGIESVKVNAPHDARYVRKTATDAEHYFVLKAVNGETIGKSEMYKTKEAMENGVDAVKNDAPTAPTKDLT
jgi:uncharacterized protein YegP (UPF0339 family)